MDSTGELSRTGTILVIIIVVVVLILFHPTYTGEIFLIRIPLLWCPHRVSSLPVMLLLLFLGTFPLPGWMFRVHELRIYYGTVAMGLMGR